MSPGARRRGLYALVWIIYLIAFPYHPGLRSPNELCRLWQTRALVEYGTLDINQALRDFGYVGDLSVMRAPGQFPRYYPSKAPLLSFAAVPIYWVLRLIGGSTRHAVPDLPLVFFSRLFLTVLPTLLILAWVRRFLATYLAPHLADAITVTYALGTLAFSYSLLFMSHQLSAVLLFACFYAVWRTSRSDWRSFGWALAGAFAGAAVAAEYTSGLAVACLAVYAGMVAWAQASGQAAQLPPLTLSGAERSRTGQDVPSAVTGAVSSGSGSGDQVVAAPSTPDLRSYAQDERRELPPRLKHLGRALGLAALGMLPFALALAAYHTACFGGPFQTGYKHLNDAAYQPWHLGGFLGIRTPDPRAFALSFFSPLRGLFALSPFLLLALPGVSFQRRAGKGDPQARALIVFEVLLLVGYAYFTSSFSYESWGWTTGPRHLTGLVPFLLLPVGVCLARLSRKSGGLRGAAAGLCVASIVITGALTGVDYIPDDVSSALFGLALPLYQKGDLPPTLLAFLGIPNPVSGGLFLLLIAAAAIWVGVLLVEPAKEALQAALARGIAALGTLAVVLLVLFAATRYDAHDRAATRFLDTRWLAPPGRTLHFWP